MNETDSHVINYVKDLAQKEGKLHATRVARETTSLLLDTKKAS